MSVDSNFLCGLPHGADPPHASYLAWPPPRGRHEWMALSSESNILVEEVSNPCTLFWSLVETLLAFFLNLRPLFLAVLESWALLSSSLEETLYKCSVWMNECLYFGLHSHHLWSAEAASYLVYAALVLWNGFPEDLCQFTRPPTPPRNFSATLLSPLLLSTEDRTLQAILSRFHSCVTARLLSSISTMTPRCQLGLTFPDFDLAPKRNERPGYLQTWFGRL